MDEKKIFMQKTREIDLQKAVTLIFRKMWLVALTSVLCAFLTLAGTFLFITPKYESSAVFYVNNNSFSLGDASLSIDSGDISASKSLVDSYIVILNSRESLTAVIEEAGVDRSYEEVREMISAASVNNTEIFEVVVSSPDPKEAELLASAVTQILPNRISGIIEGTSAKIVDSAILASKPSSPSYTVNTIVGFLIGLILSVGGILVHQLFDIMIRSDEDLLEVSAYPVLASVPDMAAASKGSYAPAKGKKLTNPKKAMVGRNISFAAAEAYKLLRMKLQFSFSDQGSCRIIGISSSISGEGKSVTSINLAYTLSQLGHRVLLIDGDMRRPTIAEKLGVQRKPGLSNYLTGQAELADLIQTCGFVKEERAFHLIPSGQNPPNPAELLSSARMQQLLEVLRGNYDYVILDLPPVIEVSDAMAAANLTDGMLLVVRQNRCDRNALAQTLRQFEFIEARILGLVFNCTGESGGSGYYKKYGSRNYEKYARDYDKRAVHAQPIVNDALDNVLED